MNLTYSIAPPYSMLFPISQYGTTFFTRAREQSLNAAAAEKIGKSGYELAAERPLGTFRMKRMRELITFGKYDQLHSLIQEWVAFLAAATKKEVAKSLADSRVNVPPISFQVEFGLARWEEMYLGKGKHLPKNETKIEELLLLAKERVKIRPKYILPIPSKTGRYVL